MNQLKNFDLVVFKKGFVSSIIILAQACFYDSLYYDKWSHVGVILTSQLLTQLNIPHDTDEKYFVLESTLSGKLNDGVLNIENKSHFGVNIRSLNKLLEHYEINREIKILSIAQSIEITPTLLFELQNFYNKHKNAKYDYSITIFIKALFNIKLLFKHDNHFICSELVTRIYQILNLIDNKIDAEMITTFELLNMPNIFEDFILIPKIQLDCQD